MFLNLVCVENNSAQGLEDILQDSPEKTQGETTSDFDIAKLLADDNNSQPLFPSVTVTFTLKGRRPKQCLNYVSTEQKVFDIFECSLHV